jgi:nucleolar complex protein 2
MLKEADGIFRRMLAAPSPAPAPAAAASAANGKKGASAAGKKGGKPQPAAADGVASAAAGSKFDTTAEVVKSPRWRKASLLVKSFLGNTLHLLGASTESAMLAFVLRRLRASAPFLGPFAKIQRRTLRAALGVFGSADNAPRVQVGRSGAGSFGGKVGRPTRIHMTM